MAALLINGVVRPQQAPTIKKPKTQRKIEGEGSGIGVSGSMINECESGKENASRREVVLHMPSKDMWV